MSRSSLNALCSATHTHRHFCMILLPKLASVITSPHHAVGDETQDENAHTCANKRLLYNIQHLDTEDEFLLKHVCCFVVQRSRLVSRMETEENRVTDYYASQAKRLYNS